MNDHYVNHFMKARNREFSTGFTLSAVPQSTEIGRLIHTSCGYTASSCRWLTGRLIHEGTTKQVGPDRSWNSMWSGPRPTTKGTTGLMHSVEPTPDTFIARCPACGRPAVSSSVRTDARISIGDYRDAAGHIWTTRWLAVA